MNGPGDFARQHVLDDIMLDLTLAADPHTALDVGCGEGRFCRFLAQHGISVTGLDPVPLMIEAAQAQDATGTYVTGFAEDMPFRDASFDAVVSYLSLIDIDDAEAAIAEMARVTAPGGRIIVGHINGFASSSAMEGRKTCAETGEEIRPLGRYLAERKEWFEWDGLRIRNWHRPLSRYMQWFLQAGLILDHFDEPTPKGGGAERIASYETRPFLMVMAWRKLDASPKGFDRNT